MPELPIRATGQLFLECFCGSMVLTLAMMLTSIPCVKPWDSKYGDAYDVLKEGHVLIKLCKLGLVAVLHLGTPCQSQTLARAPQLRSAEYPKGLPDLQRASASISITW